MLDTLANIFRIECIVVNERGADLRTISNSEVQGGNMVELATSSMDEDNVAVATAT